MLSAGGELFESDDSGRRVCGMYPQAETSPSVLPYVAGEAYRVLQVNCGSATHFDRLRFAYDFQLPIGATVVAARAGALPTLANG